MTEQTGEHWNSGARLVRFSFFFSPLPFLCFRLCLLLVGGERIQIRQIRNRMEPHSDSDETFTVSERVRTCLCCSLTQYGIARTSQGPPHKPQLSGPQANRLTACVWNIVEQHVGGMARCCGKWIWCRWQLKVIPTLGAVMVVDYVNESRSQAPLHH